jgi:phage pi2 protein 07
MKILITLFSIFVIFIGCKENTPTEPDNIEPSYLKYLKFNSGNYWIYKVYEQNGSNVKINFEKHQYAGIKEINDKKYHEISIVDNFNETDKKYYRTDEKTGYLYEYLISIDTEIFVTNILLTPGHYVINLGGTYKKWIDVVGKNEIFLDEETYVMYHNVSDGEVSTSYSFSDKFGAIASSYAAVQYQYNASIIGAYIDSASYGNLSWPPTNENIQYYPLDIGNNWHFTYKEIVANDTIKSTHYHRIIEKDTVINNIKYYKLVTSIDDSSYHKIEYERVDSATALAYRYIFSNGKEVLIDKLTPNDAEYHDTYRFMDDNYSVTDIWQRIGTENTNIYRAVLFFKDSVAADVFNYVLKKEVGLVNLNIERNNNMQILINLEYYYVFR